MSNQVNYSLHFMELAHDNLLDFHTAMCQTLYMLLCKILDNMDKKEHCLSGPAHHPTFVLNKGNAGAQPLSGYCEIIC